MDNQYNLKMAFTALNVNIKILTNLIKWLNWGSNVQSLNWGSKSKSKTIPEGCEELKEKIKRRVVW